MLKARENPEASGNGSWDLTLRSSVCFLGHILSPLFQCKYSQWPWGREAIKEALMDTRASPFRFHTEISPCLPKFNPHPEWKSSSPAPTRHLAGAHFREKPGKASETRFDLMSFHFGKDLGAKLWPATLALMRLLKKKETTNPIFVVKSVASLWLSLPSFLS